MAQKKKWEGKVRAMVKKASADQIWPLFTDFFNLHHWFQSLANCYGVNGSNDEPGCVRFCAGFSLPSSEDGSTTSWSKERLLVVDHADRCLTYEMVDGNIGFESYVSTVKIVPGEEGGCEIEWEFSVDPVDGWAEDDLVKKYDAGLQLMTQKMEDFVVRQMDKSVGDASLLTASY